MYRDSELGLCIDVAGPDGNVFNIWATGDMLAKQIGCLEEWRGAVEAAKLMEASYPTFLAPEPMVGRIGRDPVNRKERRAAAKIARTQSLNSKKETK